MHFFPHLALRALFWVFCCGLLLPAAPQARPGEEELRRLERRAQEGETRARIRMGDLRLYGPARDRDPEAACRWYGLAAEKKDPDALLALGRAYLSGQIPGRDRADALPLLREARLRHEAGARLGRPESQYAMGLIRLGGWDLPRDPREAAEWFERAARQGHPEAALALARLHLTGRGVPRNREKAAFWYGRAADQGSALGQFAAGFLLEGDGNLEGARLRYRQAAGQGYALAQTRLGDLFSRGDAPDRREAARWYGEAARSGSAEARCRLGLLYEQGRGLRKDPARAEELYRQAAREGSACGRFRLAALLLGASGCADSCGTIRGLLEESAGESPDAAFTLGFLHETGCCAARDLPRARRLYGQVCRRGLREGCEAESRLSD